MCLTKGPNQIRISTEESMCVSVCIYICIYVRNILCIRNGRASQIVLVVKDHDQHSRWRKEMQVPSLELKRLPRREGMANLQYSYLENANWTEEPGETTVHRGSQN